MIPQERCTIAELGFGSGASEEFDVLESI